MLSFTRTSARYKICPLGASEEIKRSHFLFWDPPHISETNRAKKLKFSTLVGIVGSMATCKNLSVRWRLRSAALSFYYGTPSISQ